MTLFTTTYGLYLTGISLISILALIFSLSIYYYRRAKDLAPHLARLEDILRKIAEAQNTLEELKAEFRIKLEEMAKAEKLIADGKAAEEFLRNEAPKIQALAVEIETNKSKLKEAEEAYKKRQNELNELTQMVADKNVEIKSATERKDALDISISRLKNEADSLDILIRQNTEKAKELNTLIERLFSQKNKLEADVKDLERRAESLEMRLNDSRKELAQIKADTAAETGKANAARTALAEYEKTQEMTKDRWQDLDRVYVQNTIPPQHSNLDELQWLKQFTQKLNTHGFIFNERSINAFHTGLKCADNSPLVVLAGISGTGKSLLPELYAASLGMNFLPVSVQPRWDSPQDLFGFYNYMEGRYKATELSRLLWQYDQYNNPGAKEKYSNHIPMNIVLLDEMNLAKVEYYFSDMLSKLEIRHGLDPANPESRRKAEIEIESNASAENDQKRRLFVALNTLFIGTMNEDESTQTLSDKVIDRANVLRFGRPKKLAVKPSKEKFLSDCNKCNSITFTNWQKWCQPKLNQQNKNRLEQLITDINSALAGVGRPFGHRVSQAIEKYVSCYPDTFDAALADQIEMKILPKLNGLDPQVNNFDKVMLKIQGIIGQVNDIELLESFKSSREAAADSFFKWRGVMR